MLTTSASLLPQDRIRRTLVARTDTNLENRVVTAPLQGCDGFAKAAGSRTRLAQNVAEVISSGRMNWSPVPVSKATSDRENAISAVTRPSEVTTVSGIG